MPLDAVFLIHQGIKGFSHVNPYQQVLIDAEIEKQRKRDQAVHHQKLDETQLSDGLDTILQSLRDMVVKRPVEYKVFLRLIIKLHGGMAQLSNDIKQAQALMVPSNLIYLTPRQKEAVFAYREAVGSGHPPVKYVSEELNVSKQRASHLIKRVRVLTDVPIVSRWSPTREQINKKRASIPRQCAGGFSGCMETTYNNRVPLCKSCHEHVAGKPSGIPMWILQEADRIERDHYRQAVDACYEEYYRTVAID